jgi:hypothetical protein
VRAADFLFRLTLGKPNAQKLLLSPEPVSGTLVRRDKQVIKQEPDAKELDFLRELEKHVNKWVAITGYGSDEERVVASGDSILEARQKAESQGFKDTTFFKVPPSDKIFVPLLPLQV